MAKQIEFNIGEFFLGKVSKIIRKKEDVIILLLETVKMFSTGIVIPDSERKGKVILKIDKMSRLFFEIENKCFSFNFPFSIKESTEKEIIVYDCILDISLDAKIISIFLSIFSAKVLDKESLEDIFFELLEVEDLVSNKISNRNIVWKILEKLMLFESGYLRYDYDLEYENGLMHPINHLDICFSSGNTFKIGLHDNYNIERLVDIMDIQTECYFLEKH